MTALLYSNVASFVSNFPVLTFALVPKYFSKMFIKYNTVFSLCANIYISILRLGFFVVL